MGVGVDELVAVAEREGVRVSVEEGDGVLESEFVDEGERLAVTVVEGVRVLVAEGVALRETDVVGVAEREGDGVGEALTPLSVDKGVLLAETVVEPVDDRVLVGVGVLEAVLVPLVVGVPDPVGVFVAKGVPAADGAIYLFVPEAESVDEGVCEAVGVADAEMGAKEPAQAVRVPAVRHTLYAPTQTPDVATPLAGTTYRTRPSGGRGAESAAKIVNRVSAAGPQSSVTA